MQSSTRHKAKDAPALLARAPLATAILLAMSPAQAQQTATPMVTGRLDEIVVTAQKREESLQRVPLSIQAFGTAKLEELNITGFDDYVKFLPSVSYQTFGPGYAAVYMRGVASGGDGNHSGSLPSVGIYLDEQPITTIQGALDVHLYDIARVEALAGPQGTLYGASSQAGTLRIITNKPDPSGFSAGYSLEGNTVSKGGQGYVAEGHVNMPISDTAAIRLVGWTRRDAGYIDNAPGLSRTWPSCDVANPGPGCTLSTGALAERDFNEVNVVGARAALRVELGDNWTISPTVMGQKMEGDGVFAHDTSLGDLQVRKFYPDDSSDKFLQASLTVEGKIGNLDLVYAGAHLKRDGDTRADYSDYSYFYDALYGSGYYFYDDGGDLVPGQYIRGADRYKMFSHELRISTPKENRARFVGGLFVQRQTHDIQQRYLVDGLTSYYEVTGWDDTIWLTKQERINRDKAIFGELSFDLTDKLTANVGLRYFEAENSLEGFFGYNANFSSRTGESQCFDPNPFRGAPCRNLDRVTKEDDFTSKVNLAYQFDGSKMAYITWSEGFRPGGVNRRGTLPPYKSDFLTNYEIGWKTSWAGGRLRFNGALFHQSWDDFQFSLLGQNGLTEVQNAAQAEIQGLEMDVFWAATDALTLSGGIALIDSELTKPYCGFVDPTTQRPVALDPCPDFYDRDDDGSTTDTVAPEAPAGNKLPVTPDFKANLTARYELKMGSWDGFFRASMVHQGKSRSDLRDFENGIMGDLPGYTLADFSAGISRDGYSIELLVNNVTDRRTALYRFAQCAEAVCGGTQYTATTPPRTIGLRFSQKF